MNPQRRQIVKTSYPKWQAECLAYLQGKSFQLQQADAEEVYQSTWAYIWKTEKPVPDLRKAENKPWLFQKLRWFALNHMRGKKRYKDLLTSWLAQPHDLSSSLKAKSVELQIDLAIFFELFVQVNAESGKYCQELLAAYYKEDLSVKDLAARFAVATQTIKNQLATCRRNLKTIISQL